MRRSRLALAVVASALLPLRAGALQDAPQPPKTPVFAAGTEVVLVDFVVSDSKRRLVGGLTAADFVVKEDGKERPVVSFRAFERPVAPPTPPGEAPMIVVEPPQPGVPFTGAVTVLLIDDGQLTPPQMARLRPSLKSLLAKMEERSGGLAILAPWSKLSVARLLPGGTADLSAAVDRIQGRARESDRMFPVSDAEAIDAERGDPAIISRLTLRFVALNPGMEPDQAQAVVRGRAAEVAREARIRREDVYGVLFRALDWLAKQPGRHSVVMVSAGFAYDPDDTKQREIATRSLRANAPIHFLDARGLQGLGLFQGVEFGPSMDREAGETPFAWSDASAGATNLADDTGGVTVRNTNDFTKGLGELLETMDTYYVIGYEPPEHEKPGFHKIKVEVKSKDLKVRARKGYFDKPPAPGKP